MKKIFGWLFAALLLVFVILGGALGWLAYTNPVVAWRYVSLFIPEDGNFDSLQPRETVPEGTGFGLQPASDAALTIEPAALAAMRDYAAEQNSWALIVVQNGVVQTEWYAPGWSRTRLTQSQSMHKSVLPVLIQAAIEDGFIGALTDPVGQYIPEWQDDDRGAITIENLLRMQSGLREYPFSLNPWSDSFRWLFGEDTVPVLLRTPLDSRPGEEFVYNNVNAELLGLIIERATGRRYAEYLGERLWGPMGGAEAELWLDRAGGKAHSSCCLLATPMDWVKFGLLLLGRGEVNGQRIIAADFVDRMVSPAPNFAWYGYQIWLGYSRELNPRATLLAGGYQRIDPFLAEDTYYTSGFGAQRVYVVPSAELVIVRMGPSSGRAPVKATWDNTYLVNTALRNQRSAAVPLAAGIARTPE